MIDIGKDLQNAFDDGYKQAMQDGWIPVSERLPVEDGRYLIMLKNLTGYDVLLENIIIARYIYSDWDYIGWADNSVIAWQSLPEPYKEG